MTIGAQALALYSFLQNEGLLSGVRTVAELGSIEYEIKEAETKPVFECFFSRCNAPTPQGVNPKTGLPKGGAKEFYECLGYEYVALDLDGRFGSRVFDLNYDELPEDLIGWSDLTTNLGTLEHVFDQAHCFRIAHELTKPGGLMLHWAPSQNLPLHGLFQYSPSLYNSLAAYNDYEVLGQWVSTLDPKFWLPANAKADLIFVTKKIIVTLMRRNSDADFVVPLQVNAPQEPSEDALNRRYNAFFNYDKAIRRPISDTAFVVDFQTLESRKLTMDEVMSVRAWREIAEGGPKSPLLKIREFKRVVARQREAILKLEAAAKPPTSYSSALRKGVSSLRAKLGASRPRPR
jgi:hypothetical protein